MFHEPAAIMELFSAPPSPDSMDEEARQAARTNHNRIEKRRRDKMNTYIGQLAQYVPACLGFQSKKLDKLTVLKLAVHHMRHLQQGLAVPALLSSVDAVGPSEIEQLFTDDFEGFVFGVDCTTGEVRFLSGNATRILGKSCAEGRSSAFGNTTIRCRLQRELEGQTIFQLIHPADHGTLRDQLRQAATPISDPFRRRSSISPDLKPSAARLRSRSVPFSSSSLSGPRRTFYCRFKHYDDESDGEVVRHANTTETGKRPAIPQFSFVNSLCSAYVKSVVTKPGLFESAFRTLDNSRSSCSSSLRSRSHSPHVSNVLIAFARLVQLGEGHTQPARTEFGCRFSPDGRFVSVEDTCTTVTGYRPAQLVGKSLYAFCHPADLRCISDAHRFVLANEDQIATKPYRFHCASGKTVCVKTRWRAFKTPPSSDVSFIIATTKIVGQLAVAETLLGDETEGEPTAHHSRSSCSRPGLESIVGANLQPNSESMASYRGTASSLSRSTDSLCDQFTQQMIRNYL